MGDLPDGGAAAELRHSTSFSEPNPFEIRTENWATADRAAREIIQKVQPTSVSEERRREVVDYIQRLIRNCLGAEVFPYGSVPLKTYLPDGDIDLTTFGGPNIEDALVDDMKSVLEEEEKNAASEFVVKDVQLIRAEVKIVKCIVQDIVVDVSFNQIGGLCTLCFLEQVDRLIGKHHLFKRSIILIKAWCYYESRILGAHHGLISTYGLETLVLYIFHLYHSTLDGPLAVLHKFLDYFSKFDWETYCVSINGPIRLSSLPAIIVEMPEDSDRDLLLSNDFLNSCVSMFSVPSRGGDKNSRGFQLKHLNIVDPLKEINNLGRSVSKGNFYRIRSAFSYGARKLATILLQPKDSIANELYKFFPNTMARHGGGQRPDVQDFDPSLNPNGAGPCDNDSLCESSNEDAVSTGDLQSSSGKLSQDSPKRTERTPKPYHAPHLYFANSKPIDATTEHKNQDSNGCEKNNSISDDSDLMDPDRGAGSRSESPELLSSSDLSGDYEAYLQCLHYGRWCYEYGLGMHSLHMPPMPNGQFQNNGLWEHPLSHSHFKLNGFSHRPHNGFHPTPPVYPTRPVLLPLGWEEVPKPKGTGYFPNTNQPPQAYRSPPMKGRSQAPSRSPRNNNNGRNVVFTEPNMVVDRSSSHEQSQPLINSPDKFSPCGDGYFNANGSFVPPEGVVELELSEKNNRQLQKSQPALSREQDRISLRSSYRLKDEDDFPPLPV